MSKFIAIFAILLGLQSFTYAKDSCQKNYVVGNDMLALASKTLDALNTTGEVKEADVPNFVELFETYASQSITAFEAVMLNDECAGFDKTELEFLVEILTYAKANIRTTFKRYF